MKRGPKVKSPRKRQAKQRIRRNSSSTLIWRLNADGRLLRSIVGPAIQSLIKHTNLFGISQWTSSLEEVASSMILRSMHDAEKALGIFATRGPGAAIDAITAANSARMAVYTKPIKFTEVSDWKAIPTFGTGGPTGDDPEKLASDADRKRRERLHASALKFIKEVVAANNGIKQIEKLQIFCKKNDLPYFQNTSKP